MGESHSLGSNSELRGELSDRQLFALRIVLCVRMPASEDRSHTKAVRLEDHLCNDLAGVANTDSDAQVLEDDI